MHRFEGKTPSDQATRRQWFDTPNSSWAIDDKDQARRCIEELWKKICGDVPDHVATRPEVADARERVLGEWLYKGNSLGAFVDHCTLHLRTLMYVLYREKNGARDQSGVVEAHEHLSRWFKEDPVPNDRLSTIAAITDRQSGPAGAASHIWLFCETGLWEVIENYAAGEGSAWNLATTVFARHVRRPVYPEAPPPIDPPPSPPRVMPKSGKSEPPEPEPAQDATEDLSDERARKRARETRRFLTSWDKDLSRREKEKKKAIAKREKQKGSKRKKKPKEKPSGERLQYLTLMLCYRYWPGDAPLIDDTGALSESEATDYENPTEGIYERVANELEISVDFVKVSIHRARLYVRDGLRRYPLRLEIERRQDRWQARVRLNRFAVWDTVILLSCTPTDVAQLSSPMVKVGSCDECSDAITLTTDFRESGPTALTFPREYNPGETATGELRMSQCLVRAFANGRSIEEWVNLHKQVADADVQVLLTQTGHDGIRSDPMPLAVRVGREWHPLPFTLNVAPSKSTVQLEFDTSHASSQLVGLEFVPGEVIGGDVARAVVTLGVRLTARAGAHPPVIGLLPIIPPASRDGTLSSADARLPLQATWQGSQAQIMFDVTTKAVADKVCIVMVTRLGGTADSSSPSSTLQATGTLTLLPPVLRSLKLLSRGRQVSRIRAGRDAKGEVTFDRAVVRDTEVALTTKHRGVHVKSPPVIVSAGSELADVHLEVADDALAGNARIVASANGTALSTSVDVTVNRFVVSFTPYTLVPGSVATGTIRCDDAVSKAVRFELSIENEGAGGTVRVKKGEAPRPWIAFSKRTVDIPAGNREAHFEVRPQVPVSRRVKVVIVAKGLGAEASGKVSLAPRARRQKPGGALADGA